MKNLSIIALLIITACSSSEKDKTEADRALIIATELEFAKMAEEVGVAAAFYEFAADSAVINRGGKLIKGKEAIREYYQSAIRPGTRLIWSPDFADVSGDLGYTYGKYTHLVPDSIGNFTEHHGIFHTVWRREKDGRWRFVWD
jgi:ketosteroid isomerase-like protein